MSIHVIPHVLTWAGGFRVRFAADKWVGARLSHFEAYQALIDVQIPDRPGA